MPDDRDEAPPRRREAAGPFEGYRLGATDVPVRIRDLSTQGCLVELSFGTMGRQVGTLQIDLPVEGWTVVQCETIHTAGHHAFVKFIRLNEETRRRIERTIDRLLDRPPEDDESAVNGEANDD
jgi:hypothetical protein